MRSLPKEKFRASLKMDRERVLEILDALSIGIDPATGEVYPADAPYPNVEVTRALFTAIGMIKGSKAKKPAPRQGEDEQLKVAFEKGIKTSEIAKTHQRTSGAIRSRLK